MQILTYDTTRNTPVLLEDELDFVRSVKYVGRQFFSVKKCFECWACRFLSMVKFFAGKSSVDGVFWKIENDHWSNFDCRYDANLNFLMS